MEVLFEYLVEADYMQRVLMDGLKKREKGEKKYIAYYKTVRKKCDKDSDNIPLNNCLCLTRLFTISTRKNIVISCDHHRYSSKDRHDIEENVSKNSENCIKIIDKTNLIIPYLSHKWRELINRDIIVYPRHTAFGEKG
jgi:hypothetical protein